MMILNSLKKLFTLYSLLLITNVTSAYSGSTIEDFKTELSTLFDANKFETSRIYYVFFKGSYKLKIFIGDASRVSKLENEKIKILDESVEVMEKLQELKNSETLEEGELQKLVAFLDEKLKNLENEKIKILDESVEVMEKLQELKKGELQRLEVLEALVALLGEKLEKLEE